ncbi:MAG: DUF2975 domain-containing protein [Sphingomonadales bacterium]|nr:DUF2975 domain-containing protein [Sphingomonadales bacterium]
MTSFRADPLLGLARGVLVFIKGIIAISAAAIAVALPVCVFMRADIIAALARDHPPLAHLSVIWALCGLLVAVLALLGALWFFVQKLKQIVDTVATGDPFIPQNAERLKAMAWTAIAIQVISAPVTLFAAMIAHESGAHANVDVSLNGIGLALVLFILARVFRTGAAMREELEGTV